MGNNPNPCANLLTTREQMFANPGWRKNQGWDEHDMWAAGAVLLITGSVIGIPLWRRHFEAVENAKTHAQARPEPAPKATEESPY